MDFDCEPEDSIEILKRYFKHSDRIYSFNIGTSYKFYTLGVCHCDPDKDHLYVSRLTYEIAEVIDEYLGDKGFIVCRETMTIATNPDGLITELSKLLNIPLYHESL